MPAEDSDRAAHELQFRMVLCPAWPLPVLCTHKPPALAQAARLGAGECPRPQLAEVPGLVSAG
eukprot:1041084-Pelagomonas_calceolata.AAC.1